jgi:maleylacetoacetate isomerase
MYNARMYGVQLEELPQLVAIDAACMQLKSFRAADPDRQPDDATTRS